MPWTEPWPGATGSRRRSRISTGVVLDLVVDFLTYVVVPLVALWRSGLLAPPFAVFRVLRGRHGFGTLFRRQAHEDPRPLVSRFPAIWNVLVFYLLVLRPGPLAATLIVAAAAGLMFTPVVFVHPLRVVRLRLVTMTATGAWSAAAIAAVEQGLSQADSLIKAALVAVAVYFLALPLFRNIH